MFCFSAAAKKKREFERQLEKAREALAAETGGRKKKEKDRARLAAEVEKAKQAAARAKADTAALQAKIEAREAALDEAKVINTHFHLNVLWLRN